MKKTLAKYNMDARLRWAGVHNDFLHLDFLCSSILAVLLTHNFYIKTTLLTNNFYGKICLLLLVYICQHLYRTVIFLGQ